MKKILIFAAAIAIMAACAKTQVVNEDSGEIGVSPVSYMSTKVGAVIGTAYPNTESFNVFACHTSGENGESFKTGDGTLTADADALYLDDYKFVNDGTGTWHGNPAAYWPKTGSLYFAGYSPADITKASATYDFNRIAPKLTITDFEQGGYNNGKSSMHDLMWFDVTSTSANTGTPDVVFKHALSYITFSLSCDESVKGIYTVKNVTLKDIYGIGTFDSGTAPYWTFPGTTTKKSDLELYNDETGQAISDTPYILDNIPTIRNQAASATVTYLQKASASEGAGVIEITETFKLTGGDGESQNQENWLMGKHYTYTLNFTMDPSEEIKLTPSVNENWTDVTGSDIEVPGNKVPGN